MKVFLIILAILAALIVAILIYVHTPKFGRAPRGERLERIQKSPNYHDGRFWNLESTPTITDQQETHPFLNFLLQNRENRKPPEPIEVVKSDLKALPKDSDYIVWFGHSSYLLQIDGIRFLVDPVFYSGSPVSFVNRSFKMTYHYRPADMPNIDYLVITHDHWDHLDYKSVKELKPKVKHVLCPLGVGEHFERWKFDKSQLVEMDWNESNVSDIHKSLTLHCLPQRHFSGRLGGSNTLWASFLIESGEKKVFLGGDGGYGKHFKAIGDQFGPIDLAVLENGQYSEGWPYIHTLPKYLLLEIKDLQANNVMTVHHGKYALSHHSWDEPYKTEQQLAKDTGFHLLNSPMGAVVFLDYESNR